MFNPEEFLDTQITESNSTVSTPIPAGEYLAVISGQKARQWQGKKDPTMTGVALDIEWELDDQAVKDLLERDKVVAKQGIMLDMNDAGQLDMGKGKNIGLGRLREALNLNVPGQAFSFNMLQGQMARVAITHRIDGENIYAEVKSVTKVS
jgi:hypothetical protein